MRGTVNIAVIRIDVRRNAAPISDGLFVETRWYSFHRSLAYNYAYSGSDTRHVSLAVAPQVTVPFWTLVKKSRCSKELSHQCATFWPQEVSQRLPVPYSPDLAPRDYFLFPKLKGMTQFRTFKRLGPQRITLSQKMDVGDVSRVFFNRCISCISVGGMYFK